MRLAALLLGIALLSSTAASRAAAAADEAAAEEVARLFLEAGSSSDREAFLGLLTAEARAAMGADESGRPGAPPGPFTIGRAVVEGELARVPVTTTEGGVEQRAELRMRLEEGAWRVFGVALTIVPGQPEFFMDFEHPEAVLDVITDAFQEGLEQAFGELSGSTATEPELLPVDPAAYESAWRASGAFAATPAAEAMASLAAELGVSADWSNADPAAMERPVTLRMDGMSRMRALEEIARQAGVTPFYRDDVVYLAEGERGLAPAFAGPFLLEVTQVREYPPHATGVLSLELHGLGLPAAALAAVADQSSAFVLEDVTDAGGRSLLDAGAPPMSSGPAVSGGAYALSLEVPLANLLREATSIASIRARFPVAFAARVESLAFSPPRAGESRELGNAALTLASAPEGGGGGDFEFAFRGVDLDDMEFVARDAAGAAIAADGRSGMSFGDEGTVTLTFGAEPASIEARIVTGRSLLEYEFELGGVPLMAAAEMPAELSPARFEGEAPVAARVTAVEGDDSFKTLKVEVENRSDKAVRRLEVNLRYLDREGNLLEDWSQDQYGPQEYDESGGPPILAGAGATVMLEFTAFFMPEETVRTEVEVLRVGFADATEWSP